MNKGQNPIQTPFQPGQPVWQGWQQGVEPGDQPLEAADAPVEGGGKNKDINGQGNGYKAAESGAGDEAHAFEEIGGTGDRIDGHGLRLKGLD